MTDTDFLHAAEHKAQLRSTLKHERRLLREETRQTASWQIGNQLRSLLAEHQPDVVALYLPLNEEPDLRPLAQDLTQDTELDISLALPRVAAKGQPLIFNSWRPKDELDHDKMGLPCAHGDEVTPGFIIMPCLAFDQRGYRLGYGGGYYDMTLRAQVQPCLTALVAFSVQEVSEIPNEYHDQRCDWAVTERETIVCR